VKGCSFPVDCRRSALEGAILSALTSSGTRALEQKLQEIVGLRNIIVHIYADVKAEAIYDNLGDIIATLKETARKLLEYSKEKNVDP
jgi:uncharacterized protein YutE (UPF0331/DUF86 family)